MKRLLLILVVALAGIVGTVDTASAQRGYYGGYRGGYRGTYSGAYARPYSYNAYRPYYSNSYRPRYYGPPASYYGPAYYGSGYYGPRAGVYIGF